MRTLDVFCFRLFSGNIALLGMRVVVLSRVHGLLILVGILIGLIGVHIGIVVRVHIGIVVRVNIGIVVRVHIGIVVRVDIRVLLLFFHLFGHLFFHIPKLLFFGLHFRHCVVVFGEFMADGIDLLEGDSIPL